jgi:hypothetical protein
MHSILNHSLVVDFPQFKETIHALKLSNAHFKHLLDRYQTVDNEIVRIETELEPASDARTQQLKHSRLQLKDELIGWISSVRQMRRLVKG